MVDGAAQCIELARDKQSAIDAELHKIVRMTKGVPLKLTEKLIGKIRHSAIAVPTGKHLMTPINKILQVKWRIVGWNDFPAANQAFRDWRTLLKEAARKPMTAKELVIVYPKFLGWVDASGEGVGGGWLPGKYALEPKNWRLEWPKKLRVRLITLTNPGGRLGYKQSGNGRKASEMVHRKESLSPKTSAINMLASSAITRQQCCGNREGRQKSLQQQDVCLES